jgi:hypothetical protein
MARWLSARATAGGWFMLGLAGFGLALFVWAVWQRSPSQAAFTFDDYVPFSTFLLLLAGTAVWLLRRRRVVRNWLNDPVRLGSGEILGVQQLPFSGYRVQLKIDSIAGQIVVNMGYLGRPNWQVGEDLALIFWENGRFCPRHIEHIVDFGYLPTPERKRFIRRRVVTAVVIYLVLVALAILMGLYGQGRL